MKDIDPRETQEWLDSFETVVQKDGLERAKYIINSLIEKASFSNISTDELNTSYINTIPVSEQIAYPGDEGLEKKIRAIIRWNAMMMVIKATKKAPELGGHIASYASIATLFEVGFNHFFRAFNQDQIGDLVFFQGHSSPGVYSRAFLEGRLTEENLNLFRQECNGGGLSSYPHPRLMPSFWQFPTVSMGLSSIQAVYQARFDRYMINRGLLAETDRKIWAFLGDGEMDEPESLSALGLASRERLDNLIFVVNCNLQRLDGPVRGNGKVIQELERIFKGFGWNVIKVVWGDKWDDLLERDENNLLKKRMNECLDGDYQNYWVQGGQYIRENFFGKYPELIDRVSKYSDQDLWKLNRGGHDPKKIYAAYNAAFNHKGTPTVVLAKTVKGFGMGSAGEGLNTTHQQKKMTVDELKSVRDRFDLAIDDQEIEKFSFYKPDHNSPEIKYIHQQRKKLGGFVPSRKIKKQPLAIPAINAFDILLKDSTERDYSTTMAFVRIISALLKDQNIGKQIVPIIPDESRTFGMEGLFRQYGIYSPDGQLYTPEDSAKLMYYRETKDGQVLEEGINEAGAFAEWLAAGTSYHVRNKPMIPFFIFYSMFGFQRIGDLAWAAGDIRARGILVGATSGRTTLAGEGLQHTDGHSQLLASTIPSCITYNPTYAYELAVIIQNALFRMYKKEEDIFYYITITNENHHHPKMPKGIEQGILQGMYKIRESAAKKNKIQLLGSGAILREVIKAANYLEEKYGIFSDVWSVTSFTELKRQAQTIERNNRLAPQQKQQKSYVSNCLAREAGPFIAATDFLRSYAEQIRSEIPGKYVVLGTDGFGMSDTRSNLRKHFEVNSDAIVYATLYSLYEEGNFSKENLVKAHKELNFNKEKIAPYEI